MTKKSEVTDAEERRNKSQWFKEQIFSLARAGVVSPATIREKEHFMEFEQGAFNIAREGTCNKILRASVIICEQDKDILSCGANHSSDREPCGDNCVRKRKGHNKEPVCYYSEHSEKEALDNFLRVGGDYSGKQLEIYNFKFWKIDGKFKGISNNSLSCKRCLTQLLEHDVTKGIYRVFEGKGGICSVDLKKLDSYKKGNLGCDNPHAIRINYDNIDNSSGYASP